MTQLSSPPFGMANRSENLDSKGDGGTVRSVTVASGYATLAPSPWKSRFKMIRAAVWNLHHAPSLCLARKGWPILITLI
ncbi:hypothetical protein GTR04_5970 [Trichophyton interdigitale]|uniref:Uncharacterized protein n=1 Tax=Trichophyton interdigitale (strain MR816) TaxID=1215338 RepID=A0A059JIJ7_TRIIM|nr:hypothetical protein GY631_5893 [Trichophyton interdigitale]KAG5218202.1 hypothetical protein GY632_5782 [Trichophyton interdigitale]KAG8206656.1 hypothetical protein GTR04_5970 [Trichophyton interdigitale]KDB27691.1 hypothetical protein H109_00536 [Trichophyton interdigitale MR816]